MMDAKKLCDYGVLEDAVIEMLAKRRIEMHAYIDMYCVVRFSFLVLYWHIWKNFSSKQSGSFQNYAQATLISKTPISSVQLRTKSFHSNRVLAFSSRAQLTTKFLHSDQALGSELSAFVLCQVLDLELRDWAQDCHIITLAYAAYMLSF